MKWCTSFWFIDGLFGLLVTIVIQLALIGKPFSGILPGIVCFLLVVLVVFNIHFFCVYLWKSKKISIWRKISSLLEKIYHKDMEELEPRSDRIKMALSEAAMLVENPPPGPKEIAAFNQVVLKSTKNLCAISSKDICLWQDSTFLFYFMLSGLKGIERKNAATSVKRFFITRDQRCLDAFKKEETYLLSCLAKGETLDDFFGIRFLIYPQSVYDETVESTKSLLRIHWLFNIHCIPLVEEHIKKLINPERLKKIFVLSKALDMEKAKFPDLLLIDNIQPKISSSCVCYYNDGKPKVNQTQAYFDLATKTFQKLASIVVARENAVWSEYSIDEILTCGLGFYK